MVQFNIRIVVVAAQSHTSDKMSWSYKNTQISSWSWVNLKKLWRWHHVNFLFFFQYLNSGPTPCSTLLALFLKIFFEIGSLELFAQVASNRAPPDLCLLSSYGYRRELLIPGISPALIGWHCYRRCSHGRSQGEKGAQKPPWTILCNFLLILFKNYIYLRYMPWCSGTRSERVQQLRQLACPSFM
jgi:hypothetical protein